MRSGLIRASVLALAVLVPGVSHAQPAGVALRWDRCHGEGGRSIRSFACDTNAGEETLVASFMTGANMPAVTGLESRVDFWLCPDQHPHGCTPTQPLPEWWHFRNAGSCRRSALRLSPVTDTESPVCPDWASGQASGAIGAHQVDFAGPGTARIALITAVPQASAPTLDGTREYFAFTLRVTHDRTVGDGACGGCQLPLRIILDSINVVTPVPEDNRRLSGPLDHVDSNLVIWSPAVVPTRKASWAGVRALFR